MKAARLQDYGGKDALAVMDAPKPEPDDDAVLVEVHAAGINPFDWKVREGLTRQMAELKFPATIGGDFAGDVVATGKDVRTVRIGDAVYGQAGALSGQGSFAEFVPVKAGQLAPKPKSTDFIAAAALPLAAGSAYQALVDHMDLQKGQKILVHGGAGGIGSMAIQLAKHLGAYVATTVSAEQAGFVKSLGADEVIDYKGEDFGKLLKGFDAVFDTVGGGTTQKSYGVLRPGGALVSMVAQPDEELVKRHGVVFAAQFTQVTTDRLQAIAALVDQGALKPVIDKVFPLDEAAEALEYQKTGSPQGKVVLRITAG
jgi:NADPH:quinone reductase-like Zn-dependent oxidoreductase